MKCLRLEGLNKLVLTEAPDPGPRPGEVIVSLRAASLNHRDLWIKKGQYAGVRYPCVLGSDGAGIVESGADDPLNGRSVILNPSLGWGPDERVQGPDFSILGLPSNGTFATRVAIARSQLSLMPAHLSFEEAAALPLAGLTAWRALVCRGNLRPSDRVLITGAGGGVALFALRLSAAFGAATWVSSGSDDKITRAETMGARGGFNYNREGWAAEAAKTAGPFDLVIDGAGGEGFDSLLDLMAPAGRLVIYGATRGDAPDITLRRIFWKQLSVLGSTMGSPSDWNGLLAFVEARKLKPIISDVFPFEDGLRAFDLMEQGGQFGKIVLRM